jgi:AcrR family transcriptional regulator
VSEITKAGPVDRGAMRRSAILDAASTIFAQRGYHRATIASVARECGVADGTIYNYFADKRELLSSLLDRLARVETRKLDLGKRSDAGFAELVRAYVNQRFAIMWDSRELLRAVLPELLCDAELRSRYYLEVVAPARARGEAAVRTAAAAGELSADPAHLTRMITGAAFGILMLGLLGDDALEDDLEACAEATADLVLHGVATG